MKKFVATITDKIGFKYTRLVKANDFHEAFKKIEEDDEKNGNYLNPARKIEVEIIDKEIR